MGLDTKVIKKSFEAVKPIAMEAVTYFYEQLLANYPLQDMFANTDMERQKGLLIKSLVYIVENVDNPKKLVPYLENMGGNHLKYGVEAEHYEWVGNTLLDTFANFFGDKWTEALESQWSAAYEVIMTTMLKGAEKAAAKSHGKGKVGSQKMTVVKGKNNGDDIQVLARELAREMLKQCLESELDAEFFDIAKDHARTILRQSLKEEAGRVIGGKRKAS